MTQTTLAIQSYDEALLGHIDMYLEVEPKDTIRAELPAQCRFCPVMATRLGEMAFWLSEGRVTAERAAAVLIEKSSCIDC